MDAELKAAAQARDWGTYFRLVRERAATATREALIAPPPEHTSRDPWPGGFAVPGQAASLCEAAEAAGWVTRVQYARGFTVCKRKVNGDFVTVLERRHSMAVRMWHEGRQMHAVALWESLADADKQSWKSAAAWLWRGGELPRQADVSMVLDTHGTQAGYKRHLHFDEEACDACQMAHAEWARKQSDRRTKGTDREES